jgi:hypothetical protein
MFFFLCYGGILIYMFTFVWYMNTWVYAQANFACLFTKIWYLFYTGEPETPDGFSKWNNILR